MGIRITKQMRSHTKFLPISQRFWEFEFPKIFSGFHNSFFAKLKSFETPISVQPIRGTLSLLASWPPVLISFMPTFSLAKYHGTMISTGGKVGFTCFSIGKRRLVWAPGQARKPGWGLAHTHGTLVWAAARWGILAWPCLPFSVSFFCVCLTIWKCCKCMKICRFQAKKLCQGHFIQGEVVWWSSHGNPRTFEISKRRAYHASRSSVHNSRIFW